MRLNLLNRSVLTLAIRQGRNLVKVGLMVTGLASVLHLVLGADPTVVLAACLAMLVAIYPLARYSFLNLGAVLIFLVGFRYVGFPLVAKLSYGQALNTHLLDPSGSYGVVLVGVLGYIAAFWGGTKIRVGRPLLRATASSRVLGRISILAAVVGITANLTVALRAGEPYSGVYVADFFVPFLHLALISGVARAIKTSRGRRSVDGRVAVLLMAEIAFSMVRNSRMVLMEILLIFIATNVAFEIRIKWRQFASAVLAVGLMIVFITPIFLHVRSFRSILSWTQRIRATIDAAANWPAAFANYMQQRDLSDRMGWYLNYFGRPQNVLERMSLVNHVDVLKVGTDSYSIVGIEDLRISLLRAMPRFLAPDKPLGYSQGYWLYSRIGIPNPGPYSTAPLIGTGYAAFRWSGAFLYPLLLGFAWMLVVKKISGWNLHGNIWAIYILLRVHDQFVEGSSDAYVLHVLRSLPQDLILLWVLDFIARARFLPSHTRELAQFYGK